jgi:hypothetical protein
MRKLGISVILCGVLLSGCAPKTPMEKLQDEVVYSDLTQAFWAQERQAQTPLWKEAKVYCQQNARKPNCPIVLNQIFFEGSTNVPKYGTSGSSIHVPDF